MTTRDSRAHGDTLVFVNIMIRKEIILKTLDTLTASMAPDEIESNTAGFSANELSERTGYDRSNVSRDLNALVYESKALKLAGRPVRFLGKSAWEHLNDKIHSFDRAAELPAVHSSATVLSSRTLENLIGVEGSIKSAIDLAKMSVLYPRKLNILLMGETGVGKTTFAEAVYFYARKKSLIDQNASFVSFNCSEYADNPQLLFSHLFGHVKGAFTGANYDKSGLVEEAKGGILLLDEIHRLKHESQEMLFHLIDRGCYRKLGETGTATKADLMLIGATTERIDSFLLNTFKRRFPIVIHIPALDERTLSERFQIIAESFYRESRDLRLPLCVKRDAMLLILTYPCTGNIGQLISDIQLACANCFRLHIDENREMSIDPSVLSPHIQAGASLSLTGRKEEANRLMGENQAFLFDARCDKNTHFGVGNGKEMRIVGETSLRTFHREIDRVFKKRNTAVNSVDKDLTTYVEKKADDVPDYYPDSGSRRETLRIITTCITGEGSAVKIAERIKKEISLIEEVNILVLPMNVDKTKPADLAHLADKNLLAVVGTVNPNFDNVPFIPLEDVVLEDGIEKLRSLLKVALRDTFRDEDRVRAKTMELLRDATMFIDNEKVMREGEKVFDLIETDMSPRRLQSLRIRFLLHLACMLERVLQKLPLEISERDTVTERTHGHYKEIRRAMKGIEAAFGVEIPDVEIRFLNDLIYTV
jgi:transcriptional regulator with AAA-type ATPase domain